MQPTGVVMPFLMRVKVKGQILSENDLNASNWIQIIESKVRVLFVDMLSNEQSYRTIYREKLGGCDYFRIILESSESNVGKFAIVGTAAPHTVLECDSFKLRAHCGETFCLKSNCRCVDY